MPDDLQEKLRENEQATERVLRQTQRLDSVLDMKFKLRTLGVNLKFALASSQSHHA